MAIAHRRRCAVDGVIRLLEESTFERRHAVACGRSGRPWEKGERPREPRRPVACFLMCGSVLSEFVYGRVSTRVRSLNDADEGRDGKKSHYAHSDLLLAL